LNALIHIKQYLRSYMVREEIGAHGRESWDRVQAIWKAIDDYAELETGNREYFWNRPHSIG
jgi:hypothetical protein